MQASRCAPCVRPGTRVPQRLLHTPHTKQTQLSCPQRGQTQRAATRAGRRRAQSAASPAELPTKGRHEACKAKHESRVAIAPRRPPPPRPSWPPWPPAASRAAPGRSTSCDLEQDRNTRQCQPVNVSQQGLLLQTDYRPTWPAAGAVSCGSMNAAQAACNFVAHSDSKQHECPHLCGREAVLHCSQTRTAPYHPDESHAHLCGRVAVLYSSMKSRNISFSSLRGIASMSMFLTCRQS